MEYMRGQETQGSAILEEELINLQGVVNHERIELGFPGNVQREQLRTTLFDLKDCQALRGAHLMIIEDSKDVISALLGPIVAVTRNPLDFVLYHGEGIQQFSGVVCEEQEAHHPDFALFDGELWFPGDSESGIPEKVICGEEVMEHCIKKNPDFPPSVGFSFPESCEKVFIKAGAVGFVFKCIGDLKRIVRDIALIYAQVKEAK